LWYQQVVGGGRCPIVDTWWQTETGAIMITPLPGITECMPGSATLPFPGVDAAVVDERDGEPQSEGQGLLVLKRPWPSMLRTLYKEEERFIDTYFSRFGKETYLVGDAARKDTFWVIGRIVDVVNVSGHRLSTAEVESVIVSHPKVAEAAVIGQADDDTGQAICAFANLQGDLEGSEVLIEEIRVHVSSRIGKFTRPKRIIWADDLPKTRSGKIMRRLLRDIAEGRGPRRRHDPARSGRDVPARGQDQGGGEGGRGVAGATRGGRRRTTPLPPDTPVPALRTVSVPSKRSQICWPA
jgi:acetyl-CoA synthetase